MFTLYNILRLIEMEVTFPPRVCMELYFTKNSKCRKAEDDYKDNVGNSDMTSLGGMVIILVDTCR